jgi:hypothetical protein
MKDFKISMPDDLGQAVEKAAFEQGKTPEEVLVEAAKHEIGRRWMDKLKREGDARRSSKTQEEIDAAVNAAIEQDRKNRAR